MELVESLNDLNVNIKTIDNYLKLKIEPEYSYGLNLVKRGICFIALKENELYKFYPSRFIGYVNNDMESHKNNEEKDGRVTNKAISRVLNIGPLPNTTLEELYQVYCHSLGFKAQNRENRKYWVIS
jgi:hypothetical protein